MKWLASFAICCVPLSACVITPRTTAVGRDFQVVVKDRGRAVAGLEFVLQGDRRYSAISGSDGYASFHGVEPGRYSLHPHNTQNLLETEYIDVTSLGPRQNILTYSWPASTVLSTRSARGKLTRMDERPIVSGELRLLGAVSGREVARSRLIQGRFEFGRVRPAIYFLEMDLTGERIAIEITPSAPNESLDIDIGETSCGLYYSSPAVCSGPTPTVRRFAGRVVDSADGPISNAAIRLEQLNRFEQPGLQVFEATTSRDGGFVRELHPGEWHLTTRSPGFTSLRRTIQIDPQASRSTLVVQLGLSGACGTVRAE